MSTKSSRHRSKARDNPTTELQERRRAQDGFMMPDRIKNVDLRSPLEVEDMYRDRMRAICRAGGANFQRVLELESVLEVANAELQERREAGSAEPVMYALTWADGEVFCTYAQRSYAEVHRDLIISEDEDYAASLSLVPLYATPRPAPDSEAQATLKRLAVILHGLEVDLGMLTITAQSLMDRCKQRSS
ncbi:hypothetical protein [Citrobacter sp. R-1.5.2]|uniref:hypothetical protein n=1 Tax=Citrobacter sp. R-1.5.2 TaxID=3046183 RepID=UPI002B24941C|nr:hypothetical protein [Citrobacter sp. R-1.5.2]MEB2417065.1 hypothetical protein [Citrobacter sp. R-1.5.2]